MTNEWSESKEVLVMEGRRGKMSEEGKGRRRRGRRGGEKREKGGEGEGGCPGVGDKPE